MDPVGINHRLDAGGSGPHRYQIAAGTAAESSQLFVYSFALRISRQYKPGHCEVGSIVNLYY
jgi:hypothetical protein